MVRDDALCNESQTPSLWVCKRVFHGAFPFQTRWKFVSGEEGRRRGGVWRDTVDGGRWTVDGRYGK